MTDLKSVGLKARGGSSPPSGTKERGSEAVICDGVKMMKKGL